MAKKSQGPNCVLTLPLITEQWQNDILETRFKIAEHLQNSLIALELRKLKNLERTKAWRLLQQEIEKQPKEKRSELYERRKKMLQDAGFSEFAFKDDMTPMQKHFVQHIANHISHTVASNVWTAFEKYLYDNGKEVHFKRRGSVKSIASQEAGGGMRYKDGVFCWDGGRGCPKKQKLKIRVEKPRTDYEKEMLKLPMKRFRIIRKWMKTRYKYYLQFTLSGYPVIKDRPIGTGRVGIDIGTQSIAICSAENVSLRELADKVNKNHTELLKLQRKMDRSRRAMNPDNYNDDGTIRRQKGVKLRWTQSKRYRKLAGKARELQRKNADIRKYQHICLANEILSLGTEIYVEPMDYRALQKRAKKTEKDKNGRFKRKKRFGKSLANKAPATLLLILENKLKSMRLGELCKVDKWQYRASQYDHLSQKYKRKKLSQRTQILQNGDIVQRDLYSAFLLMNADQTLTFPEQTLCDQTYPLFKRLHDAEIQRLQSDDKPRLSSFGIA